jgi:hypothetical protein
VRAILEEVLEAEVTELLAPAKEERVEGRLQSNTTAQVSR